MLIPSAQKTERYNTPKDDIGQNYNHWMSANGTELITSERTVVLITNPFEAFYAAYATAIQAKVFKSYGSQFLYMTKGSELFPI